MTKQEVLKRYVIFLIGLFINSFGVSFITKANLGTSPISSIPYTLSLGFSPTLGMFTLYMSILLILFQILLLRKKFPKEYLLQIPVSFLFSYFIDMTMQLLSFMQPKLYVEKMGYLILGCCILGVGVYLEVLGNVVMLPGESFVRAVSDTFHTDFGKTKVIFDSSMTIIAGIIGFILFHRLAGVREGTVIAALFVGMIARFLRRKLVFVESFLFQTKEQQILKEAEQEPDSTEEGIVITISREFGSGGRTIAKSLAQELSLQFYDKKIIELAAQESNLPEAYVEVSEEKMTNSLLYDLFSQYQVDRADKTNLDKLYEVERKIILDAAQARNCVIVGRCADYILRKQSNCFHIFLHASTEYKIQTVMRREELDYEEAKHQERMINRKRFMHYKYYTGRVWGRAKNYDLCLDVTKYTTQEIVSIIKYYVSLKKQIKF